MLRGGEPSWLTRDSIYHQPVLKTLATDRCQLQPHGPKVSSRN